MKMKSLLCSTAAAGALFFAAVPLLANARAVPDTPGKTKTQKEKEPESSKPAADPADPNAPRIDVPKADQPAARRGGGIVIILKKDGTMELGGKAVDAKQLTAKLTEAARIDKKQPVVIRGETDASYKAIVRVLDITHAAGLYHVSFATRRGEQH
jgi:biopolymer transport protein ExbD